MELDVAYRESSLMRGSIHFKYMDISQMDDDVGIDAANFMQHIDTKHHGQHVADKMENTSWT